MHLVSVPGVQGVMLTFDDFISGMERFGTRIQPLMRSRADAASGPGADGLYSPRERTS